MSSQARVLLILLLGLALCFTACRPPANNKNHYATPAPCQYSPVVSAPTSPGQIIKPTPLAYSEAEAYLAEVLRFIRSDSVHQEQLQDWWAFHDLVMMAANDPQTIPDTYPAVQFALDRLCDSHSFFLEPAAAQRFKTEGVLPGQGELVPVNGRFLTKAIAYLELPSFWGEGEAATRFATEVQAQLRRLDQERPCGWVLDLRRNHGGNLWAMLAGLAPMLPEGWVGSLVFADGRVRRWHIEADRVLVDGLEFAGVAGDGYQLQDQQVPVAVLVSSQTGSAAEGVLVAFLSRPETRVFGEATVGKASANRARTFPDGAMLFLATAWFADPSGQIYDGRILPDEQITNDWSQFGSEADVVLQRARAWLGSQPDCTQ